MPGITKKDLETVLDKKLGEYDKKLDKKLDQKFGEYQEILLDAINTKFSEVDARLLKIEKTIESLTTNLDAFLKRLTDREDEMTIMKAELTQIKQVLKQKFGIEISLQSPPNKK